MVRFGVLIIRAIPRTKCSEHLAHLAPEGAQVLRETIAIGDTDAVRGARFVSGANLLSGALMLRPPAAAVCDAIPARCDQWRGKRSRRHRLAANANKQLVERTRELLRGHTRLRTAHRVHKRSAQSVLLEERRSGLFESLSCKCNLLFTYTYFPTYTRTICTLKYNVQYWT